MKKVFLLMLTAAAFTASAVTLEKGKDWVVRNSKYTLRLEKNRGYAARLIMLNGKKIPYGMVTPAVFRASAQTFSIAVRCSRAASSGTTPP